MNHLPGFLYKLFNCPVPHLADREPCNYLHQDPAIVPLFSIIWASSGKKRSSGFPTKSVSNPVS